MMPKTYTITVQDSDNPERYVTCTTINPPRFRRNARRMIQAAQGRRTGRVLPGWEVFADTTHVDFIMQHRVAL